MPSFSLHPINTSVAAKSHGDRPRLQSIQGCIQSALHTSDQRHESCPHAGDRVATPSELSRLEAELTCLEADAAAWEEDRVQMVSQMLEQSNSKSRLEAEIKRLAAHTDELEGLLEGLESLRAREEEQRLQERAAWEEERLGLAARLEEALVAEAARAKSLREVELLAEEKAELLVRLQAAEAALQEIEAAQGAVSIK